MLHVHPPIWHVAMCTTTLDQGHHPFSCSIEVTQRWLRWGLSFAMVGDMFELHEENMSLAVCSRVSRSVLCLAVCSAWLMSLQWAKNPPSVWYYDRHSPPHRLSGCNCSCSPCHHPEPCDECDYYSNGVNRERDLPDRLCFDCSRIVSPLLNTVFPIHLVVCFKRPQVLMSMPIAGDAVNRLSVSSLDTLSRSASAKDLFPLLPHWLPPLFILSLFIFPII